MRKHRPFKGNPQPDWMMKLQLGDVLVSPTGTYRIVRAITRHSTGELWGAGFCILRCSWTRRPNTAYVQSELRHWTHTGVRVKLNSRMDKRLDKAIKDYERRKLYCWDVVGVVPA